MKHILIFFLSLHLAHAAKVEDSVPRGQETPPTSEEIFYSGDQVNSETLEERQEEEEAPVEYPYGDEEKVRKEEREYLNKLGEEL